jgi:hypothetical protein
MSNEAVVPLCIGDADAGAGRTAPQGHARCGRNVSDLSAHGPMKQRIAALTQSCIVWSSRDSEAFSI